MRPLWLAVLLVSCAGDESRRAPDPRPGEAPAGPTGSAPAHRAAPATAAAPASPTPAATAAPASQLVAAAAPTADPREATRRAAHDTLVEHCGACHEGHRSTVPRALAVFDLDQPDWPGRFDEPRYASALRRLASKSDAARAAFVAFHAAELAAPASAAVR